MRVFNLRVVSSNAVNSQIITAFFLYCEKRGDKLNIIEDYHSSDMPYHLPIVMLEYNGKTAVYDMMDGYLNIEGMKWYLSHCDVYFKRSFSNRDNIVFDKLKDKIIPLGLNYYCTYSGNPLNEPKWKHYLKKASGRTPQTIFTPEFYEGKPNYCSRPICSYWARLWDYQPGLSEDVQAERETANFERIKMVRTLNELYGSRFQGGLQDSKIAREQAPELIAPKRISEKGDYIRSLRSCDIGVATRGLHKSYGWKIGEYVCASMGIVMERPYYELHGNFSEGRNYLQFETYDECISQIDVLMNNPNILYEMKQANANYYSTWLRPDRLAEWTLAILEGNNECI